MRIAVVGAGIGGLCAAIGLQRAGARVSVFERAGEVRSGGSGLSIFGNGSRALDYLGLGEQFRQIATTGPEGLRTGQRRPDGTWLVTLPDGTADGARIVDRAALHRMLVSEAADVDIRTGAPVAAVSDGVVRVEQAAGAYNDRFDLVVAADGLRSGIRSTWPDDPGIRYAGYAAWRGITSEPFDLVEAGETWGVGERFGIAPLADGRVYWFAVATMPRDITFADERAEVLRRFGDWHAPVRALVEATDDDAVTRLPIEELAAPLPSFRRGSTVLLGDAAHAMTPNLGQGGGQSMEDAATLAAVLHHIADAPAAASLGVALDRYDALRRPRSQRIARQSRLLGEAAQRGGPGLARARDAVFRVTPAWAVARQARAVQAWQPPAV